MEWWRSYHGAPFDNKWRIVAKLAGCRPGDVAAVVWAWFDLASQNANERGRTHSNASERTSRIEEIAAGYDFEIDLVQRITDALEQRQVIVGGILSAWEKRQPKREDGSAERSREWRERKRTQANANEHREEESREDKKEIKIVDFESDFETWWLSCPRKASKGQARKTYIAARKRGIEAETLLAGIRRYASDPKRKPDFTQHGATWINAEGWLNESAAAEIGALQTRSPELAWQAQVTLVKRAYAEKKDYLRPTNTSVVRRMFERGEITAEEAAYSGHKVEPGDNSPRETSERAA